MKNDLDQVSQETVPSSPKQDGKLRGSKFLKVVASIPFALLPVLGGVYIAFIAAHSSSLEIVAALRKTNAASLIAKENASNEKAAESNPSPSPTHTESGTPQPESYEIVGQVLDKGHPAPGVQVWVIASSESGNRYAPPTVNTNEGGSFSIREIPSALGSPAQRIERAVVYASKREQYLWLSASSARCLVG
jgi:hypothetical protein